MLVYIVLWLVFIDYSYIDITQWTIWCVRNICEGNPENQAVIAALEQRGVANSNWLESAADGCEVVVGDDGHLHLKSKK